MRNNSVGHVNTHMGRIKPAPAQNPASHAAQLWTGSADILSAPANVPAAPPPHEVRRNHSAPSCGGASQSRLKTSAPSPESRVARGTALDWERRYFIGSGRASPPHRPRTKSAANTALPPAAEPFPEPVKNQRSQPRIPCHVGHSSGLGAPIFYRLRACVPATPPPHEVRRKHSAPFCGGASQSRLKTSAPSPESRVAHGTALDWERRYFIGSGRASLPQHSMTLHFTAASQTQPPIARSLWGNLPPIGFCGFSQPSAWPRVLPSRRHRWPPGCHRRQAGAHSTP